MSRPAVLTLIACVVGLALSVVPLFITATAALLMQIAADTAWSRGELSQLIATGLCSIAIGTAVVGRLIEAVGARPVILFSTVCFAACLFAFSSVHSFESALVLAAITGLFGTGASQFAYLTVLPLWFDRRLGLSLGIAMIGIGLGNALVPIIMEYLSRSLDWRTIYRSLAGTVMFIGFPNAVFLLRVPERARKLPSTIGTPSGNGVTLREALCSRIFWQLMLSVSLATTITAGLGIHLTSLLIDRGYSPANAARLFSLWGIALIFARLTGGFLLDKIDVRWLGGGCLIGAGIGATFLALGVVGPIVIVSVFLVATTHGIEGDLVPYATREYFGMRAYSTIFGLLGLAFGLGPVVGSILMGETFDRSGSYTPMLWAAAATFPIAAFLLIAVGKPLIHGTQQSFGYAAGFKH